MVKPVVLDLYHNDVVTSWEAIKDSGIIGVIHKASQRIRFKRQKMFN